MSSFLDMVGSDAGFLGLAQQLLRLRAGRKADPYNPDGGIDDWGSAVTLEFTGFIASSSSTVLVDGAREEVSSTAVLTCGDPDIDVRVGDRIEDASGRVWSVEGIPSRDKSPFTGWSPTLEASLKEVIG